MNASAWLGVILLVVWLVAWFAFKIASSLVHLLLIFGVALLLWGLVTGPRAVDRR